NAPVGNSTALTSLTTDAAGLTDLNAGTVVTTGAQSYNDDVILTANTTLTSTGSGAISFGKTVNGNFTLAVNTGGHTNFNGAVGNGTPLVSLTTDAPGNTTIGANITTTGNQSFNDNVTLTASATLTSTRTGASSLAKTHDLPFALAVITGLTTTFP